MILSEAQVAVREGVRDFPQDRIRPNSVHYKRETKYPDELFEELGSLGLFGLIAPAAYGGADADYVSYALSLIELPTADGALSTIVSIQNSIHISGLLKDGTADRKQRFLPELISGRMIGAFALTESDAGSDAAAIRTKANRVTGGWRLNGAKQFITSGQIAKIVMAVAVADPAAGRRGMTAFLIPTDRIGYVVEKIEHKLGQAASDTCALRFDDLFVEDDLVLGALGDGYRIALANLETGRIGIAAQAVGMAQAALDIAVSYAKDRVSMGIPIIAHQAVGFRLADIATRLEAARLMVLSAVMATLRNLGLRRSTATCGFAKFTKALRTSNA